MKQIKLLILLCLGALCLLPRFASAQPERSLPTADGRFLRYAVKNWLHGKEAAVTLTFDDGYQSQFRYALPLLNARSIKGTFFIVTNRIGTPYSPGWDTIRGISFQGHEVGSHSMNHADFDSLVKNPGFLDSLKKEMFLSRQVIDKNLPFQKCRSFAWPFGKVNEAAIEFCRKYYLQARSSYNDFEQYDPQNMFCLSSEKVYHTATAKEMNKWVNDIRGRGGWLIERYHGFRSGGDTNGYEPVDIETFTRHLDYLKVMENYLWIATMADVAGYIRERQHAIVSLNHETDSCLYLAVTDHLPDSLSTLPLTLEIRLDGRLKFLSGAASGGKPVQLSLIRKGNSEYAQLDLKPGKELLELYLPLRSFTAEPQIFADKTQILFSLTGKHRLRIRVDGPDGRTVQQWEKEFPSGDNQLKFNASRLAMGEYTCVLETGGKSFTIKLQHQK